MKSKNNINLETTIEGLDTCTKYELRITPIFEEIEINPRHFPFETLGEDDQEHKCVKPTTSMDSKLPKELSGKLD